MANIASAFVNIVLASNDSPSQDLIQEIISAFESNLEFRYGGDCDASYDESNNTISIGMSCRWTGTVCWEWLDKQLALISDESCQTDLSKAARKLLIASEINGYSYEWGCKHRDKVEKAEGEARLSIYQHKVSEYEWPSALEYIGAYDLEDGSSISKGNDVEVCLIEREASENSDFYLFQVNAQVGSMFILLNKINNDVFMISEVELEDLEISGSIEDIKGLIEEGSFEWDESEAFSYSNEVLDDLLCEDDLYELISEPIGS